MLRSRSTSHRISFAFMIKPIPSRRARALRVRRLPSRLHLNQLLLRQRSRLSNNSLESFDTSFLPNAPGRFGGRFLVRRSAARCGNFANCVDENLEDFGVSSYCFSCPGACFGFAMALPVSTENNM